MRKKINRYLMRVGFLYVLLGRIFLFSQHLSDFPLSERTVIGNDAGLTEVSSLLELSDGSIWVIDGRQHMIFVFSRQGALLRRIGCPGEGPGEFRFPPNHLSIGANGTILVSEAMGSISLFSIQGTFIKRMPCKSVLGIRALNAHQVIGWNWGRESQDLSWCDTDGQMRSPLLSLERDLFSVGLPDESGRMVQFNYRHPDYTPELLYAVGDGAAVAARSDREAVYWLKAGSKRFEKIHVPIPQIPITPGQSKDYEREIDADRNLTPRARILFKKMIPQYQNRIRGLAVQPAGLMVFWRSPQAGKLNLTMISDTGFAQSFLWPLPGCARLWSKLYIYSIESGEEEMRVIRHRWEEKAVFFRK